MCTSEKLRLFVNNIAIIRQTTGCNYIYVWAEEETIHLQWVYALEMEENLFCC